MIITQIIKEKLISMSPCPKEPPVKFNQCQIMSFGDGGVCGSVRHNSLRENSWVVSAVFVRNLALHVPEAHTFRGPWPRS